MVGTTWAQPANVSATPRIAIFVLKILNIGHRFGWSSSLRKDDSAAAVGRDELLSRRDVVMEAWQFIASDQFKNESVPLGGRCDRLPRINQTHLTTP